MTRSSRRLAVVPVPGLPSAGPAPAVGPDPAVTTDDPLQQLPNRTTSRAVADTVEQLPTAVRQDLPAGQS